MIRAVVINDARQIVDIYNHYITHSMATFEEDPIEPESLSKRIQETLDNDLPWFVAEEICEQTQESQVIGYAYASKWKGRCAYRYSVEVTVYLSPELSTKGWGTKLYEALFLALKQKSIHIVMAGISLPNEASIALHEKFGMKKVAHFDEIGFKFNQWVDVGYWQGKLEE